MLPAESRAKFQFFSLSSHFFGVLALFGTLAQWLASTCLCFLLIRFSLSFVSRNSISFFFVCTKMAGSLMFKFNVKWVNECSTECYVHDDDGKFPQKSEPFQETRPILNSLDTRRRTETSCTGNSCLMTERKGRVESEGEVRRCDEVSNNLAAVVGLPWRNIWHISWVPEREPVRIFILHERQR